MMSTLLSLLVVFTASYISLSDAGQSCAWQYYPDKSVPGGVATSAGSLTDCQAVCVSLGGSCQAIDFNPVSNGCWTLATQSGKVDNPGIQHYDYTCQEVVVDPCSPNPCQNGGACSSQGGSYLCNCASGYTGTNCQSLAVRDVVSTTGDSRCFKTNYPGPVTDFYSAPNGVTWNFKVPNFGFDLPTGLFSPALTLNRVQFGSSDNLAYFRLVVTTTERKVITTDPIYPSDNNHKIREIEDVKRVDFYLAPADYRRNVSINDVKLTVCPGGAFGFIPANCELFDFLSSAINLVSLGILRPGRAGTFSASIAPDYPYIDLDLACTGAGTVEFSQVSFDRTSNFDTVVVDIWNGGAKVPVFNKDGIVSNSFNYATGINFASGVRGNRIRTTIIPNNLPNQGIAGSIWFSRFSILAH